MGTAAVVGGGIAGLTTAIGLVRRGWDVEVHERAAEFTEVGAGISLWANALRALDVLGLGDQVRARGAYSGQGGFRDRKGRWLARGAGGPDELVMLHRAELLDVLLAAVPDGVLRPGSPAADVRVVDGKPVLNGREYDLLVGADGLRSTVRAALWPDAPSPRYSGHTAWRTIVPAAGLPAVAGSETWGDRQVFGVFPMSDDRVYVYAAAVLPADTRFPHSELDELRRRFADWPDPVPAVLAAATAAVRHDLYYLPDLPTYARGPVALVGDAAHAMTPNLGQGGCQAIEDAVTLAATADLRRYDALRRPRSQSIARRSRTAGRLAHAGAAAPLRDAALRLLPPALFRRQLASVLDWPPTTPRPGERWGSAV
ncbi:FAD-dependent monooxygenase [Actinokineospora auranticolor]|uniref:2-polyprenyl-6-methoxyphenol hydroxylase-like FAD-dependent oxidoreductase n=1 Tax=Actinokineospora auranticolor TaxID=155976 RepID=A0A2S6GUV3_9PSEU|nr:FAD-dependent monooxygenase [Actinokineospora auranticolor]PPK68911.1 2-polyprenyl-6-methoxyphenol hydroxylase-like FAD-dependent oxidoreductase [Actinokineospora auranticolor]